MKFMVSLALLSLGCYAHSNASQEMNEIWQCAAAENEFAFTRSYRQITFSLTRDFPQVPGQWILKLYQMMKDIHEIFVKYEIEYWADGGTLIGEMRHKGIIPWDDDLDIDILKSQEIKLIDIKPILEKLGYGLIRVAFGYKIYPFDGYPIPGHTLRSPQLDVFIMVKKENRISYDPESKIVWARRAGQPIFITEEELYPIREYRFGTFSIFGPQNPSPYLNHLYGTEWPNVGYKFNHLTKTREKVVLTQEDKVPAQPTGPLNQLDWTNII